MADPSRALSKVGSSDAEPSIFFSTGLRNSTAQTSADTGLPGTPRTGRGPIIPNISGLPGLIAIFQKSGTNPRSAMPARTRS